MNKLTHIGLDVHKETIAVATLRPDGIDCDERVIPNTPEAIRKLLGRPSDPSLVRTCYEAGPTGYDTHRLITSLGIACDVIAPSLIPKKAGVRVKTDRIDAKNLAACTELVSSRRSGCRRRPKKPSVISSGFEKTSNATEEWPGRE